MRPQIVVPRRPSPPWLPDSLDAGIALAIGAALVSGVAVYLNAFAVRQVPDPAVYTTLKNAVAAVVLLGLLGPRGMTGIRAIPAARWPAILAVGVVGGSVPFVLFFTGLAAASAPSAAVIHKTLVLWVALLALPVLGERAGIALVVGLAGLLLGQALVLPPRGIVWGPGETMILAATLLWAIETVLVRRLLGTTPTGVLATLRMGLGVVLLAGFLVVTGRATGVAAVTPAGWAWVALTGAILAGYVATWFAALRRAPATVVTSVLVLGAVVTGGLSAATSGTAPSGSALVGFGAIVAASVLVVGWARAAARGVASATARRLAPEPSDG
ncbi:MAG TPA: DMT family transporter [Candidatus Limnocylindrales bacterium]|nr:DMT family transporter [Candidatus Limnocylindrales bacterium]